jgi:hypothetical protein
MKANKKSFLDHININDWFYEFKKIILIKHILVPEEPLWQGIR